MDKAWIWKKKFTGKSIVADEIPNIFSNSNEEETPMSNKAEFERDQRILNEKFPAIVSESNSRDEFATQQAKIALEAIAGWEMSEKEAVSLKLELEKALQQKAASEERLIHLDAALKECMQQLRFVRENQEKRIHDAVMKASNEFQRTKIELHSKLDEASKRLAKVDSENSQLSKALLTKEKVIEELNKHRAKVEADFSALITRLESTEKANASLKYELRVLEKELEIRNEEREFNHRTADVSHKQHLENVKKVAKLESECQRLRLLVRKRLPGPAAFSKMKNEVEMMSKDQPETRRRKTNPSLIGSMDFSVDTASETPRKQINYLTEQLYVMEEENRTLKETLIKRTNELRFSRTMSAQTASESGKTIDSRHELSLASMSDMGSDDKVSCAESWASALISEPEQFKNGKQEHPPSSRTVGTTDMSLMDDFVEMEKLAVLAVDIPSENSNHVTENNLARSPSRVQPIEYGPKATTPAAIPNSSDMSISSHRYQPKEVGSKKGSGWLDETLQVILEQSEVLQRNPNDILEEIKGSLPIVSHSNSPFVVNKENNKSLVVDLSNGEGNNILPTKRSNQKVQSSLSASIGKIIELIEGIGLQSLHEENSDVFPMKNDLHYKSSETSTGYVIRHFQWKASDLSATLEQFVQVCNDLLNGNSDLESFAEGLKCTLDWIMNHCFSLQDVSSMKNAIIDHLDWEESISESGTTNHLSDPNKMHVQAGQLSPSPFVSLPNCYNNHLYAEEVQPHVKGEDGRLKDESAKKDLEEKLQGEIVKSDSLMIQLEESCKTIESLQKEVQTLKQLKEKTEDQSEKHKILNKDLETQLMKANDELSKSSEELVCLKEEKENTTNSCEKLDISCRDLQPQLESFDKSETSDDTEQTGRQLRTESEIATASEKLAECQETILNLGKQLKALASPTEAALFNKVIFTHDDNSAAPEATPPKAIVNPTTPEKKVHQRLSLLDKMLAEDKAGNEDLKLPKTKDGDKHSTSLTNEPPESPDRLTNPMGDDRDKNEVAVRSLAIVPSKKKKGRGFLRKLLGIGKKTNGKKEDLFLC